MVSPDRSQDALRRIEEEPAPDEGFTGVYSRQTDEKGRITAPHWNGEILKAGTSLAVFARVRTTSPLQTGVIYIFRCNDLRTKLQVPNGFLRHASVTVDKSGRILMSKTSLQKHTKKKKPEAGFPRKYIGFGSYCALVDDDFNLSKIAAIELSDDVQNAILKDEHTNVAPLAVSPDKNDIHTMAAAVADAVARALEQKGKSTTVHIHLMAADLTISGRVTIARSVRPPRRKKASTPVAE